MRFLRLLLGLSLCVFVLVPVIAEPKLDENLVPLHRLLKNPRKLGGHGWTYRGKHAFHVSFPGIKELSSGLKLPLRIDAFDSSNRTRWQFNLIASKHRTKKGWYFKGTSRRFVYGVKKAMPVKGYLVCRFNNEIGAFTILVREGGIKEAPKFELIDDKTKRRKQDIVWTATAMKSRADGLVYFYRTGVLPTLSKQANDNQLGFGDWFVEFGALVTITSKGRPFSLLNQIDPQVYKDELLLPFSDVNSASFKGAKNRGFVADLVETKLKPAVYKAIWKSFPKK